MCPLFVATSYMFLLVTHYKIPPTIFPQAWVGNHEGRHLPETKITISISSHTYEKIGSPDMLDMR